MHLTEQSQPSGALELVSKATTPLKINARDAAHMIEKPQSLTGFLRPAHWLYQLPWSAYQSSPGSGTTRQTS